MENGIGELEVLPNGLRAVFVNQPHWVSSSARLIVHAGALHEDDAKPAGVAHFFEHVAFQGTDKFRSIEALNGFADENGVSKNATTSNNTTCYMADGFDLEPVLEVVTQLALAPTLGQESLEREREAIIDEARGYQFLSSEEARRAQFVRYAGEKYARLLSGTIDEVAAITHDDLREFHERHYRLGNMLLVVCSGSKVDDAREKTIEIIDKIDVNKDIDGEPSLWNLPFLVGDLEVYGVDSGQVEQSLSSLVLNYLLEKSPDLETCIARNLAVTALDRTVRNLIRTNLTLAYTASAGVVRLENNNFGASETYQSSYMSVETSSQNLERCLNELYHKVPRLAVEDTLNIDRMIKNGMRYSEIDHENRPYQVADSLPSSSTFAYNSVHDPDLVTDILHNMGSQEVTEQIDQLVSNPRLIQIISPDSRVASRDYKF